MLHQKLFSILLLFSFTSLMPMQKGLPESLKKHLPELQNSLTHITPEFKDLIPHDPVRHSWEPYYETLNNGYLKLLKSKETDRAFVQKMLPIVAAGNMQHESGTKVQLSYAPAHYAMGVMALEDGKLNDAAHYFMNAIQISKFRPQERKLYVHSIHACAQTYIAMKEATAASILYSSLILHLNQNERPEWEHKVKTEITKHTTDITIPWRTVPALALSLNKDDRNLAPAVFKLVMQDLPQENLEEHKKDLASTLQLIKELADNKLSAATQAIMAMIHLEQREKAFCIFGRQPIDTQQELEKALAYARAASNSEIKIVPSLRGEICYRLAHHFENPKFANDETMQARIKELYKESADCEFSAGIGRYAHHCLEDKNHPLSEQEAKEHLNNMRRASRDGVLSIQDVLAKAFFLGHTFGCGYAIKPDMREAYEHAANSPTTVEMLIIRGVLLGVGVEKEGKKKNKPNWEVKPNVEAAKKALDEAISMREELSYLRLHEIVKSPVISPAIKNFIRSFVGEKCLANTPSLFALRGYGILLLMSEGNDRIDGIKLLENLSAVHKNPFGYWELSGGYLNGECLPRDLAKATSYAIKALRFYDKASIQLDDAAPARGQIQSLLHELHKMVGMNDKTAIVCLTTFSRALTQYGITWTYSPKKGEVIDSESSH